MKVLLIEDDPDVAANVAEYLEPRGFGLDFAYDGRQGFELALSGRYGVIVLDLMLPGLGGIDVCQRLRAASVATPILMLTARDGVEQKVIGFEAGADDYLVKPFALPELYHRVLALLRRRGARPSEARTLRVHDLELDLEAPEVRRQGRVLALNRIERQILETLARASPAFVSREALEEAVWGDTLGRGDLLRSYVYRLRREVDRSFDEPLLHTVHGQGYALRSRGRTGDLGSA